MTSNFIHIKATPAGISIVLRTDAGKQQIGYSAAISQLDEGRYDLCLADGLRVVSEIAQASKKGWFKQSDEQAVIVWRWLVASLFINEQLARNGTIETLKIDSTTERTAVYRGDIGGISIYPATERFALANNIEGLAFEKFGANAHRKAVMIYQSMTETDADGGNLRLSAWGRDSMALLHDGFIEMLNTEGMPAAPVAH